MVIANWASAGLTQPHDPLFMVSMRTLFWVAALVALAAGLLCLRDTPVWLKLGLLFWLALNVAVYQAGLRWCGPIHDFSVYLGGSGDGFWPHAAFDVLDAQSGVSLLADRQFDLALVALGALQESSQDGLRALRWPH